MDIVSSCRTPLGHARPRPPDVSSGQLIGYHRFGPVGAALIILTMPQVILERPIERSDYVGWRPLWDGYNRF
jgi:hypothetical protein